MTMMWRLGAAATFYCDDNDPAAPKYIECTTWLNAGNSFNFGEIQGCTTDGRYCAHMTILSSSQWKMCRVGVERWSRMQPCIRCRPKLARGFYSG
jgi:hypothetical protein